MRVSLTPHQQKFIGKKMKGGGYLSQDEVIREALRQSLLRERENEWLVREAAIGFAQLEAGAVRRVTTKKAFEELLRSQE